MKLTSPFFFVCAGCLSASLAWAQDRDPFVEDAPAEIDPFAEDAPEEIDPFADDALEQRDPFAEDSPKEIDPFADDSSGVAYTDPVPFTGEPPRQRGDDPFLADPRKSVSQPNHGAFQANVAYFTEFIEIDPLTLTGLISSEAIDLGDGGQVRAAVDEYLGTEKATLLESCLFTGRFGRGKLEAMTELLYGVEWDPGEGGEQKGALASPKIVDGMAYWPPARFPHPTTFEMRPVGTTIEFDATCLPSGDAVQFETAAEMVRFDGMSRHVEVDLGDQKKSPAASTPLIATLRAVGQFSERFGGTLWLGTSRRDEGRPVLVFMRINRLQRAEAVAPNPRYPNATVVTEFIEVDADWFNQSIRELGQGDLDSNGLRDEVQGELAGGAFSIVDVVSMSGPFGQELVSEGVVERIYPTEYDPPELPTYREPEGLALRFWAPSAYPTPTAFETRNTGVTTRAKVVDRGLAQGYTVAYSGEIVRYAGERAVNELVTPSGREPLCTMPVFNTLRVTGNLYLRPGEVVLAGAMTQRAGVDEPQSDRRILVFLRLAK